MERRVGPISLAGLVDEALGAANIPADPLDWALEGAGELANNPEVQKYLPFLPLLGLVRYKRPGVSASAREAAENYHRAPVSDPIRERDTVFHATSGDRLEKILQAGEIVPDPGDLARLGLKKWDDLKRLRVIDRRAPAPPELLAGLIERAKRDPHYARSLREAVALRHYGSGLYADDPQKIDEVIREWLKNPEGSTSPAKLGLNLVNFAQHVFGPTGAYRPLAELGYRESRSGFDNPGVSVSRVPRMASKETRPVSFVIDPQRMPPSRPFTEPNYRKTIDPEWTAAHGGDYNPHLGDRNPHFEYENRTYDQAIPLDAVKEMWLDRSAYRSPTLSESLADMVKRLSTQYNIPLREFESGRQMHSGRVRRKQK
jgi:hypothetical protein